MSERLASTLATLPVAAVIRPLNEALSHGSGAIVTAAPGAGKSTVLPLTILQGLRAAGVGGKVVVLEPRRVAARQVAARMAWLLGQEVGQTVGYRMRFESRVSQHTRIEVVTEGVLTRMLLDDAALEGVAVIVFDEFHERSLVADEAFALARHCRELLRPDLRLVVMSATIDAAPLAQTLGCPVLHSEGRMFPVRIIHTDSEADARSVSLLVARTIVQAHRDDEGDILAFLPGEGEIRGVQELLADSLGATQVLPLYGLLSADEQTRAVMPSREGRRRVVLATPIAETSLTIEGVRVVVDGGLCRKMVCDVRTGLNHLATVRISLDMAAQRTGRAGRVAPGVCYRLWSRATESRMDSMRTPEILDADLTSLVLDVAVWGERVDGLPWLTPPPAAQVAHAQSLLASLGATDAGGRATPWGRRLAALPCHPRIARMLLAADTHSRKALAADIAALLEERDPLAAEGDAALDRRVDALRRERRSGRHGRWERISRAARRYADMIHAPEDNTAVVPHDVGALLATAYPERIGKAWREGVGVFQLSGGGLAAVEPSDALAAAEWIVAATVHQKPGGVGRVFLAAMISPADLAAYTRERDIIAWDARALMAVARREVRLGAIVVESKPLPGADREQLQQVVCQAIVRDGASLLSFTPEVQQLQRRVAFVAARHPELSLPPADAAALSSSAAEWGPFFVGRATTAAELRRIDLCAVIRSRLDYGQQQALDHLAPTHVVVPTGSRLPLDYRDALQPPVLRVRLQECFGLTHTPVVDGMPVLMELLSPGYKPVQLTTDLHSFWQTTYFEVRKELRRRYPKHAWPDDPLEAEPVRGVKRRPAHS